jgi:RNA polymerase sigma-70 factor, ECF subfamily
MVIRVPDKRTTSDGYAVLDDRLLVLDFQAGNPQAFVEIHRRYGRLARHVCQRFLPQQSDVDEAFQETMIRVFQGLYRFNGRYALQPWVARIAKNVSLDMLRGQARRPQADDSAPTSDELPIPGDEADEIVERLVQRDTVLSVLSDLPETHRRALMLRELEGRSHREIAQELEISTSQAKALIHRAKGAFRRRWLEKVADRGRLMGIALLPLLWAARFGNGLRRVADRFGHAAQVAQAAAPEALTSTVSSTAAPVVSSGVSERIVAAGMTILLAGGMTVGAAKIVTDRADEPADRAAVTAPTPIVTKHRVETPREDAPVVFEDPRFGDAEIHAEPPVVVEPSPSPVTETSPEPDPSPSPEADPPPQEEPPPPPPAPAWSLSVDSSIALGSFDFDQVSSRIIGNPRKSFLFSETVEGLPASDDALVQRVYIEYRGSVQKSQGSLDLLMFLDTALGRYRYDATGLLESASPTDEGGTTYVFTAGYARTDGPIADEAVPTQGTARLAISFWPDGTLYEVGLSLLEG